MRWSASAVLVWMLSVGLAYAGPAYVDPEKTDGDFAVQGEYSGEITTDDGKQKFAVQIIAQGKGKFRVVGYHGGLPGDGWNGEKPHRVEKEVELKDGVLTVEDKEGKGVLRDGVLTIFGGEKELGKLKRIERKSPTLGAAPPEGAVVLFDGKNADAWQGGRVSPDGLLMEGTTSKQKFGSHTLHIEFRLPYMPEDRGQGRGNSGLYLQGRYEVQMLDSFGLEGKDNECGGVYSVSPPDLNMCLPPLAWQTYDVEYTAGKYDDQGKVVSNPRMTVRHNGVVIHKDRELPGQRNTTAAPVKAGPDPGPIYLQNHGNPVRYRNVWVVEKK